MWRLAVLFAVLTLGCVQAPQESVQTTTTWTEQPTTTIEATTTSEPSTTTTLPPFSDCDMLNASFWRALCHDREAYSAGDAGLCGTVYCQARLLGPQACAGVDLNDTDWRTWGNRSCEAWAAGRPFICDSVMKSGECIRWYATIGGDLELCGRTLRGVDCAGDFAYWLGNISVCRNYKAADNVADCEARYYTMAAQDNSDPGYCAPIRNTRLITLCREAARYDGKAEKNPLLRISRQIIRPDVRIYMSNWTA